MQTRAQTFSRYTFSRNLTRLRKARRLTQEEVALAIGVKTKRYQAWESGANIPRVNVLPSLCNFFAVTAEELINPS